jgi:hypothetical protein
VCPSNPGQNHGLLRGDTFIFSVSTDWIGLDAAVCWYRGVKARHGDNRFALDRIACRLADFAILDNML